MDAAKTFEQELIEAASALHDVAADLGIGKDAFAHGGEWSGPHLLRKSTVAAIRRLVERAEARSSTCSPKRSVQLGKPRKLK